MVHVAAFALLRPRPALLVDSDRYFPRIPSVGPSLHSGKATVPSLTGGPMTARPLAFLVLGHSLLWIYTLHSDLR